MIPKTSFSKRATSLILAVAILFTMIPMVISTGAASVNGNRISDPSTMDSWRNYFPISGNITTENAGGVWMDKSVFTDASAFAGLGITQDKQNSFLVALSAMAANMSVTGTSSVPTDSMLILDVSGSMNDGENDVAEELVEAANESIATLLNANAKSRVGVVLYSGSSSSSTNYTSAAMLLLPLGRYATGADNEYLTYTVSGGNGSTTETIGIDLDVVYEGSSTKPTSLSKDVVGATYIQRGLAVAMEEFVKAENVIASADRRKPVVVLMSDGAPSLGSTNFTDPGNGQNRGFNMGSGSGTSAALGFVSQLTASYTKAKIEEKYGTEALFYTLGLGLGSRDSVALSVMDPSNPNGSNAVDDFWNENRAGNWFQSAFKGYNHVNVGDRIEVEDNKYITKIETPLEQNYVDQYFAASTTNLVQVFQSIISMIQLQSAYFPTLVSESEDHSGFVSFVDRIGSYMSVTDIKGILIHDQLFSGADLASNFVAGGGELGSGSAPTDLGLKMVEAVRTRLGLPNDDVARALIFLAYENGQLRYTSADDFSNYIGWYANAAGEYLGFYHEGVTTLPAPTGNAATDPAFIIRSYGYLGEVDESHGVVKSDMMFATVQVRKNIASGEELVTFAVPAALIPTVTYKASLDRDGNLSELSVEGATNPIRLVYEVALDDSINSFNVKEMVSAEYLADPHNVNSDGSVNFYTNQWEHQNTTGYGTVNTYSYFNPSRQNDKYYYQEDATVYRNESGALYEGDARPADNETVYRAIKVYTNKGGLKTETQYVPLSLEAKRTSVRRSDGSWYVPKGNVHVDINGFTVYKGGLETADPTRNLTGTLAESFIAFVDTHNHSVDEAGYEFYVGATLGNNGKYTVIPETGIKLTKTMADGVSAPSDPFTFHLSNLTDLADNTVYPAWHVDENGIGQEIGIAFTSGVASVELKAGEALYIGGMTSGDIIEVREEETVLYLPTASGLSANGTVTVAQNEMRAVSFVNDTRGTGSLTVTKEISHQLGADYTTPADKEFSVQVTLSGIETANQTFRAKLSSAAAESSVQTDANGSFRFTLKDGERLEIFDIPNGTVAAVVEENPGTGFTPTYFENDSLGDGILTVQDSVFVEIINSYVALPTTPADKITLSGTKDYLNEDGSNAWLNSSLSFEFALEKATANGWDRIGTAFATGSAPSFSFDLSSESYTAVGAYTYRIVEIIPDSREPGLLYDTTEHSFTVIVTDADMDGALEISSVISDHDSHHITYNESEKKWAVRADFVNTHYAEAPAPLSLHFLKQFDNKSQSPLSYSGFLFLLFSDAECTTPAKAENGIESINYVATASNGKGKIDLVFDEAGSYTFWAKEDPSGILGMQDSSQVVKIDVTVTQKGSALEAVAVYSIPTNTAGELVYTNTYDPTDAVLNLTASKVIIGRDMKDGEIFTFELASSDNSGEVIRGSIRDLKNGVPAEIQFEKALRFEKVGQYRYHLTETTSSADGLTADGTTFHILVTVSDQNGTLVADYQVLNHSDDSILFTNRYSAQSTTYTVTGEKVLEGKPLLNDEFTFEMVEADENGNPKAGGARYTVKNDADGSFAFEALRFTKAGSYHYLISEIPHGAENGIVYDTAKHLIRIDVSDDLSGNLVANATLPQGGIRFVNRYVPAPTSVTVSGNKVLLGQTLGEDFEFELYEWKENGTIGEKLETVKNNADGSFVFTKFGTLNPASGKWELTEAKSYYFMIREVGGGQDIDGILYDSTVYYIRIDVEDNHNGLLIASVHAYDQNMLPQMGIDFENEYRVTEGDSIQLGGSKDISGREMTSSDVFTFEIYASDENGTLGEKLSSTQNSGKNFAFTLSYTPDDVGKTFYYLVKEALGGTTVDRVTYDNSVYLVSVTVKDGGKGKILIEDPVIVKKGSDSPTTLSFVNVFTPKPADASLDISANKVLLGRDMKVGEVFTFELCAIANGAQPILGTVRGAKNGVACAIVFEKSLSFSEEGEYHYTLKETTADGNGLKVDKTVYEIVVTVEEVNGRYEIDYTVTGQTSPVISFTNTYTAKEATATLSGKKYLNGNASEKPFSFNLYESNSNWTFGEKIETAENGSDGIFTFTKLGIKNGDGDFTFTRVGSYYYLIREEGAGQDVDGILYDSAVIRVRVDVSDDGNGQLVATVHLLDENGQPKEARFDNLYRVTEGCTAELGGKKEMSGREMTSSDVFTFEIYASDENGALGEKLQSVQNSGKDFKFTLNFKPEDAGKTLYYLVKEALGGTTADRVTYDDSVYLVSIKAKDGGGGVLVTEAPVIVKKGGTAPAELIFRNVFTPKPADLSVSIQAQKTVKNEGNGTPIGPEGFEFVLEEIATRNTVTKVSDENGLAQFALTFSEDDIGSTFRYTLSEKDGGNEKITYSKAVYEISITISLGSDNKLVATVSDGTNTADSFVGAFENVYDSNEAPPMGDSSNLSLYLTMMILSGGAVLTMAAKGKKKRAR